MMKFLCKMIWMAVIIGSGFEASAQEENKNLKLFLAGDVMTGRGIDQALQESVDPVLYEPYVKDARDYLMLAERVNGEIRTPLSYAYIWGDALEIWNKEKPDLKLINLETSITTNSEPWPGKGIHYRMHPGNVEVLKVPKIDHISLANNHVLDWKRPGLLETMRTLNEVNIRYSGVGKDPEAALTPSVFEVGEGRVLVYSFGSPTAGVPPAWAAGPEVSGVNYLPDLGAEELKKIKKEVTSQKKENDIVVFSVHWGGNWGYEVPEEQRNFAHQLIDKAGVDVVFGHSSHHPKGVEVYKDKLIIYGAGDFINDYEGITGHEKFRGELTLMYFPVFSQETGNLQSMEMIPMEIRKFRLNKADKKDAKWLKNVLSREGKKTGTSVRIEGKSLWLEW